MWSVLFYALVGVAFLLKGVGPVVVIPACVMWMLWGRRPFRDDAVVIEPRRLLLNPIGLVVGVTLVAAWPLAAWWNYPDILHTWRYQTGQRMMGNQEGREVSWGQYAVHFFDYVWMLPGLMLPWLPALLICLIGAWRKAVIGTALGRFSVCWMLPGFVFFTAIAWRHQHYVMPVVPPLAWACAYGTAMWIDFRARQPARRGPVLVLCGLISAATAYGVIVLLAKHQGPLAGIAVIVGVAAVVVLLLDEARRAVAGVGVMIAATVLSVMVLQFHVLPDRDGSGPLRQFAQAVNRAVPTKHSVTLLGLGEHQIAFYLDTVPRREDDVDAFIKREWFRGFPEFTPPFRYLLCTAATLKKLEDEKLFSETMVRSDVKRGRASTGEDDALILVRRR